MNIEIWSDFACPFCYIGKTRFEKALARFEHKEKINVIYKAYQLNPHAPLVMSGTAVENFAQSHGLSNQETAERFARISESARNEGLEFHYDIMQMTKTFDAHRLAKWAAKFSLENSLTSRLMKAYFTDGLNIADKATLAFLAKGIGLDEDVALAVLNSNQFANQVLSEQAEARQIGVQGVPFFVLNQKYGVSGAQSEDYFFEVIKQLWQEEGIKQNEGPIQAEYCDDEGCHIE